MINPVIRKMICKFINDSWDFKYSLEDLINMNASVKRIKFMNKYYILFKTPELKHKENSFIAVSFNQDGYYILNNSVFKYTGDASILKDRDIYDELYDMYNHTVNLSYKNERTIVKEIIEELEVIGLL